MKSAKRIIRNKKTKAHTGSPARIVVIGASAGGLEAVSTLLKYLSPDTGMSYFYVQHLSPDHPSNLPALLSTTTSMKVEEVRNNLSIQPNRIYVCTPNKEIGIVRGKIKLIPRKSGKMPYLPINTFFASVAKKYGNKVIGIILSGNATDGTTGLNVIKENGGVTIVQDKSAKYQGMPKSAIDANTAMFVLSPLEIARSLERISRQKPGDTMRQKIEDHEINGSSVELKSVLDLLHRETGIDFSHYKMSTLKRRLNYRMLHSGLTSLPDYLKLIQNKSEEAKLLSKDLLINVTSFFRDPPTFRYLRSTILPKLFKSKHTGEPLRIWVPACSTGEEAYSIAIIAMEIQKTFEKKIPIHIFATDLSEQAIQDARAGEYTEEDLKALSKSLVQEYFAKTGDHYRVAKELREICVFATHNLLSDPPFSKLDFISCCNLLIYFDAEAQKKALSSLNFALNKGGYLMLGKSESIGNSSGLFTPVHTRFKIYTSKNGPGLRNAPDLKSRLPGVLHARKRSQKKASVISRNSSSELDAVIDAVLLSRYMPACALINKDSEIIKFRGSTSRFLSHPSGNASLSILKMVRPEFAFELRHAIQQALKTKQSVSKSGFEIKFGAIHRTVSLEVTPLKINWTEPLLLVVFMLHESDSKPKEIPGSEKNLPARARQKIKKLTDELKKLRIEMHAVVESQEAALAELQVANEEIVSTNEEFQTLNEELETSKEEIEATNEELISTNHELQMRNDLLSESYEYSEAIIATIHEPLLILDSHLNVQSANKSYLRRFMVTQEDIAGVSVFELENKLWDTPQLHKLLTEVVSKNAGFSNLEIKHHFPDIGEKVMLLNAHRIVQKTHREQCVLLAMEDITERVLHHQHEQEVLRRDIKAHKAHKIELEEAVKRRTRQLRRKNIELEDANKDLTSFTYVSSHDLQEPLRKIRNFVSVLMDEEKDRLSDEGKDYLKRAYATANRMQTLIEALLSYARTKKLERNFEFMSLRQIIEEASNEFEEKVREGKVVIKYGRLSKLNVVHFQFLQLFQNLISNSLKFSKPNSTVTIRVRSAIVKGNKINRKRHLTGNKALQPDGDYCEIIYSDDGIGFDPQYNERVFQVFQRLHNAESYSGSGMGLAICQRIVENHNGLIYANGIPNKGVTFYIVIPMGKPDHAT